MTQQALDLPGLPAPPPTPEPQSRDARRTARNRAALDAGTHPATGLRLVDDGRTCGDCPHHRVHEWTLGRRFHKCVLHRLGQSHSAASDIRIGWPACVLIDQEPRP